MFADILYNAVWPQGINKRVIPYGFQICWLMTLDTLGLLTLETYWCRLYWAPAICILHLHCSCTIHGKQLSKLQRGQQKAGSLLSKVKKKIPTWIFFILCYYQAQKTKCYLKGLKMCFISKTIFLAHEEADVSQCAQGTYPQIPRLKEKMVNKTMILHYQQC